MRLTTLINIYLKFIILMLAFFTWYFYQLPEYSMQKNFGFIVNLVITFAIGIFCGLALKKQK